MENDNKNQSIGFQEKGADQIYQRLFSGKEGKKHFLLADEVGLGKTITAANVIERILENNTNALTRIGYICSNLDLAQENKEKLMRNLKNAKPRIISGDRLSLFVFDYYGFYDSNTKYIFNELKDHFTNDDNRLLQYIYLLAPINDSELFFQYWDDYHDRTASNYTNNWLNSLLYFKSNTSERTSSVHAKDFLYGIYDTLIKADGTKKTSQSSAAYVKEKLVKYFQNHADEIKRFCKDVNDAWKERREKYVDRIRQFNGKVIKEFPVKDPVTMKLFEEIVTIWNENEKYRQCNVPSYQKNTKKTKENFRTCRKKG